MSLGTSFLNVFDRPGRPGEGADDLLLLAAIATLHDASAPHTLWIARVVTLHQPATIPRSVTLSFAPGARLVIEQTVTVRGFLDAGLEARFEVVEGGVVELLGPLDEIVADWWLPDNGRDPVELALHALWTRYAYADDHPEEGILPAPIRLDGPYELTRTLRIRPPARLTGRVDVVLRGQHGRPFDPPTFLMGPVASQIAPWSMVSVEKGVVLTMEHVGFDNHPLQADSPPLACLSLEGTFHGSRIEACSFRFDGAGIRVSPGVQHWAELLVATGGTPEGVRLLVLNEAIGRSTASSNRLELSRCNFTGETERSRALAVGLGAPISLTVRDCQFGGVYGNAISVLGGQIDITACQFANSRRGALAADGADVFVHRWGDEEIHFETTVPLQPAPTLGVVFYRPTPTNVYRGRALSNTQVTITHCVSTSPTFLTMDQAFPYADTIPGGAMLTNVRHAPAVSSGVSVYLGAGAPARSLMLQGCRFGGSVSCHPGTVSGAIVDLGTRFVGLARISGPAAITLAPVME